MSINLAEVQRQKEHMTDIEILREVIEIFAVQYFDTIEMSGTVKSIKKSNINYLSIDLTDVDWDKNLEKLNHTLTKYLKEWVQKNSSSFKDYVSISRLTIEYKLPEKDGANQNQSKHIKLFYLPSYYFKAAQNSEEKHRSWLSLKILIFWHNILLRNAVVVLLFTILLIILGVCRVLTDSEFGERLIKSYEYVNIASGIIASFVLGFLINKVIAIRQDKLRYTRAIRGLSNKLTYFRNICYNLIGDHIYWSKENPFYESYEYAISIKDDITFEEYIYPNYMDDIEYAKFKSFHKENMSRSVVSLVLQLYMMADDSFLDSGLTYTEFPPDYIYSHDELEKFYFFSDRNFIWYCSSDVKIFPNIFASSYRVKKIIEDINRIYPDNKIEELSRKRLEEVSLDFQYRIIPRLYRLTRLVESKLPITIRYFVVTFILLLAFGLIIPTIAYMFIDKTYAFLGVFFVIGIVLHILLSLRPILETENTLDKEYDYL